VRKPRATRGNAPEFVDPVIDLNTSPVAHVTSARTTAAGHTWKATGAPVRVGPHCRVTAQPTSSPTRNGQAVCARPMSELVSLWEDRPEAANMMTVAMSSRAHIQVRFTCLA